MQLLRHQHLLENAAALRIRVAPSSGEGGGAGEEGGRGRDRCQEEGRGPDGDRLSVELERRERNNAVKHARAGEERTGGGVRAGHANAHAPSARQNQKAREEYISQVSERIFRV
jgi:hypothetical protein